MFENIVVGYAGDQAGRDAAMLAVTLTRKLTSHLTVAYPYHPLLGPRPVDREQERVRAEIHELTGASGALPPITCHPASHSWPIHALHDLASSEGAHLIVFGAAHEGLADRLHISLMERMVHGAPCAVAVAPSGYADTAASELRRVGVGFSESHEGRVALHVAHELARILEGQLEVLGASAVSASFTASAYASALLPQLEDEIYADTEADLKRAVSELEGADVSIDPKAIKGDPTEVLIEHSNTMDLLLLGSRDYGPLRHALLGSVSAAVMRDAHCPVLVVPRGAVDVPAFTETRV